MKTSTSILRLKAGKEKSLQRRHPWIYSTAVDSITGSPQSGETIKVVDSKGRFQAWAAFSPLSTIRARCWTFDENEKVDEDWITSSIAKAVAARQTLNADTNAIRLVFGEADLLPGLIVDQYADQLVTQFQSCGVEFWRDSIVQSLVSSTGCKGIFDRSDAATRLREGLPKRVENLYGSLPPEKIEVVENQIHYLVDVRVGHKTGFYIDQRDNRALAYSLAKSFRKTFGRGMRALNCFCYTGGFSLALKKGGADEVISIDSSDEALSMAKQNALLNGFKEQDLTWIEANVFEELRKYRDLNEKFDLVILDPPKFASSHHHVDKASRAYKDINLNGLKLLKSGGQLLTFSCSGAIDSDLFQKIIAGAVFDAKADVWMLKKLGAGFDHPLLMTLPEGEYLKGLHLLVRSTKI